MHWTAGFRRGLPRKLDIALRAGKDAVLQFVFENSQPVPFSGCWLWRGPVQENGYGYIVDPRRPFNRASPPRMLVPRLVCETVHGKMPADWQTRHQCHVPSCVNPDHLLPGTVTDNLNDSVRDGRWTFSRGIGNGRAKITLAAAAEILYRRNGGEKTKSLASAFNVSTTTIRNITNGRHWTST